jgi:cytochrome c-type protein NapB
MADRHPSLKRFGLVGLALAMGVAFTGFFVGIRGSSATSAESGLRPVALGGVVPVNDAPDAPSYGELAKARRGPNAQYESRLDQLSSSGPDLFAPVSLNAQDKGRTLALRASRRAYAGAPPVVPHSIDQLKTANCLACHGQGLRVGEMIAPRISHPVYSNCTQCHVESSNRLLTRDETDAAGANGFVGVVSPTAGERAWVGAPPTVPHSSWMRENCSSCHGVNGREGIRSSHPWRQSCTQCHGLSAELDQVDFMDALAEDPFAGVTVEP